MPIVGMPDGTQVQFPDDMPDEQIKGLIATKFPDAVKGLAQQSEPGPIEQAVSPFTNYLPTQGQMAREGAAQAVQGAGQIGAGVTAAVTPTPEGTPLQKGAYGFPSAPGGGAENIIKGIGNLAAGGLGYLTSPINAAVRTVVGQPVENVTGIPKEIPEFAASFALPMPKRIPQITVRPMPKAPVPSVDKLLGQAESGYEAYRASKATFSPEISSALADHVEQAMIAEGAFEHQAEPVYKTINRLRTGEPISADFFQSIKKSINNEKINPDSNIRRAAGIADKELDAFLSRTEPAAAAALQTADANYAAAKRAELINQMAGIAGLRTGRAGYGGNAVNNMRQVISPIVESAIKGNPKGFTTDEIKAIRDIVEGTAATNALRAVGQLSPSKGAIQTGIAIGSGGVTAGIGAVSNKLAAFLTSRQIDRMNELLRKRSPAYRDAVGGSADRFFKAADEFAADPSHGRLLKAAVAARALANGLTRDGIDISSGKLLEYLGGRTTGSMKSGAEDEQQQP